jgi:membrane-associated phospholipid phosphatase
MVETGNSPPGACGVDGDGDVHAVCHRDALATSNGTGAAARWWLATLLVAVTSFAVLAAVIASSDAVPSVDLTVARWVQAVDFPGWTGLLHLAAYLTDNRAGPAILGALMIVLWLRCQTTDVIVLGIAQTLFFPQLWLKQLVQPPRPTEDLISITEIGEGFGFPSGHITLAVALYGTVAMIALAQLQPRWRRNAVLGAIGAIIVFSAISRPASGSHWPSDVLGGLLLGGIWLIVTVRFYLHMRRRESLARPLRRT